MYRSELETGIIRGKRQTMISVAYWIERKVELARKTSGTDNAGLVLELTLCAFSTLKEKIDEQVKNGVNTIDCSDFLPK